jgi:hypothetical protein
VLLLFEKRLKAALASPYLGQLDDEFRSVWSAAKKQRASSAAVMNLRD